MGYPGIRLEDKEEIIEGFLFYSNKLEQNWKSLDKFEGHAYLRVKTIVTLKETNEKAEAYIYTLN